MLHVLRVPCDGTVLHMTERHSCALVDVAVCAQPVCWQHALLACLTRYTLLQLYVVTTAYVLESEMEPSKGRLLLFQLAGAAGSPRELKFLGETVVAGSCYAAQPLPNAPGRIAATVNSRLVIFTVNAAAVPGGGAWKAFELECKKSLPTVALYLAIHGDTIVVGDMMQSVGVFKYVAERSSLEQVAMEYECAPQPQVCNSMLKKRLSYQSAAFLHAQIVWTRYCFMTQGCVRCWHQFACVVCVTQSACHLCDES